MVEDVIKEDLPAEALAKEGVAQDGVDEAETQVYEVGFHIVPSTSEDKISQEVDIIKSLIEKNKGVFITDESPKLINLAYTITKDIDAKRYKFDTAYFGWIKFEIKTDSIIAFKEEMDANKNIVRFLIIKTVKESTLVPKTAVFAKDETFKRSKPLPAGRQEKPKEIIKEKAKTPVSEEELDKTIEELIVE